jgi:glyoxylase-like metal-dependent hydrolase (beta-lactamase superfamily II)
MTEPAAVARRVEEVAEDLFSWHVHDDRIGADSAAYAVRQYGKLTLIDPLPIELEKLTAIAPVDAIVLTAANHQRSAWQIRRALAAPVFAPVGPQVGETPGQFEQPPDHRYRHGDGLPGGLVAFHAPGPAIAMYAMWWPAAGALFFSDLLSAHGGEVRFVPAQYQDDPVRARESVRLLIETFPLQLACFAHGAPLRRAPRKAIERALAQDVELLAHRTPPSPE